uniref:UPI0001A83545 related cluster n=1 Tax=Saccharum officinarum TaxID=4547 RepID=A0A678T534_SACOF|nr:UPI0001A83545 related cluster [Saccharum officinarum]
MRSEHGEGEIGSTTAAADGRKCLACRAEDLSVGISIALCSLIARGNDVRWWGANGQQKWLGKPRKNVFHLHRINVDGAFISSSGTATVGVVIRDHNGQVKLASWRLLHYCRDAEEAEVFACCEGIALAARWSDVPMEAEVFACCEGIALAARWSDVPMVLETNYVVVSAKLKSSVMDQLVGWSLVREARTNMEELFRLEIVKISRSHKIMQRMS